MPNPAMRVLEIGTHCRYDRRMTANPMQNREVIFEFSTIGNVVRVMAMDVKTMTEVVIQGPTNVPETTLKTNALKRLEYVLKKKGLIGD